jgi:pilus assembly protein CpaF
LPLAAVRGQLASAIDVIVQVARASGGRREIVEMAEVAAARSRTLTARPLFTRRNGALSAVAPPNRAPRRVGYDLEEAWLRCTPSSPR